MPLTVFTFTCTVDGRIRRMSHGVRNAAVPDGVMVTMCSDLDVAVAVKLLDTLANALEQQAGRGG